MTSEGVEPNGLAGGLQVRVLSVQRANRSWNARSMCDGRSYHYYLPVAALGLRMDGACRNMIKHVVSLMSYLF
jgi:tRNA U38,U39,U40 pseudouridine synthase TruA